MKKKFSLTLAALLTTAMTVAPLKVKAQQDFSTTPIKPGTCIRQPQDYIGPVNLVQLAYQCWFRKKGMPGAEALEEGYSLGKITPKMLVEAAIASCFLSPKMNLQTNQGYLNDIDLELRSLVRGN